VRGSRAVSSGMGVWRVAARLARARDRMGRVLSIIMVVYRLVGL